MKRPEQILQQACVGLLRAACPPPPVGPVYFHPANGGWRSIAEAGIFKSMGQRAGVPDLVFLWRSPFCVEFKAGKGKLTETQLEIHQELSLFDINTYVCRSLDEFQTALNCEGVPIKGRLSA